MSHHRLSLPLAVLVCAVAAGPVAAAPTVSSLAPSAGEQTSREAFEISLGLTGILSLWLGIMKIGENSGMINALSRWLSPVFCRLFPRFVFCSGCDGGRDSFTAKRYYGPLYRYFCGERQ